MNLEDISTESVMSCLSSSLAQNDGMILLDSVFILFFLFYLLKVLVLPEVYWARRQSTITLLHYLT